ncbi:hypothetical protein KK062_16740 [Fulvivirgaceae bacterium PWU5]|uniref:Uncharacterized protein n=1 Tax=Dawidia cretensis TaxID=2782350 RepID=A0AAP2DYC0_9BACT|nr:DUF5522 domain-containing protein [Dawidia cretensis]MBT1709895.1 hypothetical protein [Dawidia cretensis]
MKDDVTEKSAPEENSPYYYMENGLMVFTEAFFLKRGFCCGRGCRHCPYGHKKGVTTPINKQPEE